MSLDRSRQPNTVPDRAAVLGYGGLLPFAALALGLWLAPEGWLPILEPALLVYAGLIASFLGGVAWGLALKETVDPAALVRSVLWPLAAWPLVLIGGWVGCLGLAALFAALLWSDEGAAARVAPPWYMMLRRPLSYGVIASLTIGALALLAR